MRAIPRKIEILKYVLEQGYVTVDCVNRAFDLRVSSDAARQAMTKVGLSHVKYGRVRHGVWWAENPELSELMQSYYFNAPLIPSHKFRMAEVPHALGMNEVRANLMAAADVDIVEWQSEAILRSMPKEMRGGFSYHKIPDAVFFRRRLDGSFQKVFVEYERTFKSYDRYREIFKSYSTRDDVTQGSILYICESEQIKSQIEQVLTSAVGEVERDTFKLITTDELSQLTQSQEQIEEKECVAC